MSKGGKKNQEELLNKRNNQLFSLDLLKDMGGSNKDFIQDMLRVYIQESPKTINKLNNALLIWDTKSIKSSVHKLRSPAAMMQVSSAVKLTEFIELNISQEEQKEVVKIAIVDLISIINSVIKQAEQFLELR
jgi:HPt (histidine-containing phosphotransfer) domain-containing protein